MPDPTPSNLVTVNIDGRDIAVPKGTNMIEAAAQLGIEIPHFCYHPKLSVAGNCRMCLVEMGLPAIDPATKQPLIDPATARQRVNWLPKPQIACFTNASPGLHLRTNTPLVRDCREGVMEFLLINHPLDCPICDQAGECKLQEQATDYGRGYSRFLEAKNVKPKRTPLGPRVTLDDERCILCSRCIRFCKEIAQDDVLGFVDRGSYSTLTCFPGRQLENNYSLNTVDICPVGALTSTDFRFKMRVWFLKTTPGIDPESSVGANTEVWSREGVIHRITPRRNDEVNDTWMADSGRLLYKQVTAENRLLEPRVAGKPATLEAALAATVKLLRGENTLAVGSSLADGPSATAHPEGSPSPQRFDNPKPETRNPKPATSVAVVASGRQSLEEQFLTRRLATVIGAAQVHLVGRVGAGDGLLISADRNPNLRGALVAGLITEYPQTRLTELGAAINAGRVTTVISFGEDLAEAGLTPAQLGQVTLIEVGTHLTPASAVAKVLIPALTVFEKSGSFINQQFRLQKFSAAVPGPQGAADDLALLAALIEACGDGTQPRTVGDVWEELAAQVPVLAGLTWAAIPPTGRLIDGSAWAGLPFVEGETLHFKPAAAAAEVTRSK